MGILVAIFLGWNLGSNDAANIFGTAVSNNILKFINAAIISSVFVILGAIIRGEAGVQTYQNINGQMEITIAVIIGISAGLSVFLMTFFKIPVSTTHAILSGIIVSGVMKGDINIRPLYKIFISWFASPIGSFIIAYFLYYIYLNNIKKHIKNIYIFEKFIKIGIILVGIYGSYSLGANNVANVVGVFVGSNSLSMNMWLLLGGVSISLGIITYSKKVMNTVGNDITKLDNAGALIAVLSTAIVIHIYALYGVPVSSSQGIVGGVMGIGFHSGLRSIKFNIISKIMKGWIYSILISGGLSYLLIILVSNI
ncbi:MAG: anion permease [Fusobacteriota bacterium]